MVESFLLLSLATRGERATTCILFPLVASDTTPRWKSGGSHAGAGVCRDKAKRVLHRPASKHRRETARASHVEALPVQMLQVTLICHGAYPPAAPPPLSLSVGYFV